MAWIEPGNDGGLWLNPELLGRLSPTRYHYAILHVTWTLLSHAVIVFWFGFGEHTYARVCVCGNECEFWLVLKL